MRKRTENVQINPEKICKRTENVRKEIPGIYRKRLNKLETDITLMSSDLEKNTEFRIKWPRGDMGSLPADAEQFMLIEHLAGQLEKLANNIETGKAPYDQQQKLTLDFYKSRIEKLEDQIEKLKDKVLNGKH